jgi:hypothetical protein
LLVLLPPSEGKTTPRRGKPLDLATLAFADVLTPVRERVLDALTGLCAASPDEAARALGLSAGQAGTEVPRDAALRTAPTARASAVYTGVLYERLGLPSLPAPARRRVLIFSALWGVVRPDDRIPAYRLPAGARLPALGGGATGTLWRPALAEALPRDPGLVVDLRSGAYASMWAPPRGAPVVGVRGLTPDGAVVSHMVKAIRGDVARVLLSRPARQRPRTPEAVAAVVAEAFAGSGRRVELRPGRRAWTLDVIEP